MFHPDGFEHNEVVDRIGETDRSVGLEKEQYIGTFRHGFAFGSGAGPLAELVERDAERKAREIDLRIDQVLSGNGLEMAFQPIVTMADGSLRKVTGLPADPWLTNLRFSPSGRKAAVTHRAEPDAEAGA